MSDHGPHCYSDEGFGLFILRCGWHELHVCEYTQYDDATNEYFYCTLPENHEDGAHNGYWTTPEEDNGYWTTPEEELTWGQLTYWDEARADDCIEAIESAYTRGRDDGIVLGRDAAARNLADLMSDLAELSARATPGPWYVDGPEFGGLWGIVSGKVKPYAVLDLLGMGYEDASLIVATVNHVRASIRKETEVTVHEDVDALLDHIDDIKETEGE